MNFKELILNAENAEEVRSILAKMESELDGADEKRTQEISDCVTLANDRIKAFEQSAQQKDEVRKAIIAGKGTVVKKLIEKYNYSLSISATTRAPREGEVDGREYYFKTVDEFKSLIDYNGLIEWAQYVDNYYGTPRKFVEEEMAAGKNVILEIRAGTGGEEAALFGRAFFLAQNVVATFLDRLLRGL